MCPDHYNDTKSNPKFSWNRKNLLWIHDKRNGEKYLKAVKQWKTFRDTLHNNNSNKIRIE